MNEDNYRGDDLISRPPAGAVSVKKIGSWDILFSDVEQSLYIVPIDYHPEPFRISLSDLTALQASLASQPSPQPAAQPAPQPKPEPTPQTATAPTQKPAKKREKKHSKRKKKGR